MASPSIRSYTSLFREGIRARIAWASGNARLESLGRYCWNFRVPTFRILDELIGCFWGLDFCFCLGAWGGGSLEGGKGIHGRSSMRPTVGRIDDLQ